MKIAIVGSGVRGVVLSIGFAAASIVVHDGVRAQGKIKVLSDAPLQPALVQIAEAFRREGGGEVAFTFGTSPEIHKKVLGGESGDVVVIQPNFLSELVKAGKIAPADHPIVGRVGFGLAVRADAPARDVSTLAAFKEVLANADAVVFNNVASGNYFAGVLERLGIAEAVRSRIVRLGPYAVFDRVVEGRGNDIGVGVIPLINVTKGLRLLGPFPAEVQSYIVYAAAPMMGAQEPRAGKAFLSFLTGPGAKAALATNGVE